MSLFSTHGGDVVRPGDVLFSVVSSSIYKAYVCCGMDTFVRFDSDCEPEFLPCSAWTFFEHEWVLLKRDAPRS